MLTTAACRIAAVLTVMALSVEDRRQRAGEEGQALVEYGLILALIAVVCIVAVTALGTGVAAKLQKVVTGLA